MQTAPYNAGEEHFVTVDFRQPVTLSMIRVWNYNKSRTHAYRGVRVVRLSLDDRVIFEGEILMASGVLDGVENCSEVLCARVFTWALLSLVTGRARLTTIVAGHSVYSGFRRHESYCQV